MKPIEFPDAFKTWPLKILVVAIWGCILLLNMVSVQAQSGGGYNINWSSIDGGAGSLSGGTYAIRGTLGQPEGDTSSGGSYSLRGGITSSSVQIIVPPSAPAAAPVRYFYVIRNVPLSWNRNSQAIGYEVQVARNATFTLDLIYETNLSVSTLNYTTPTLTPNGTYYWRVRAKLGATTFTPWTVPQTFVVNAP